MELFKSYQDSTYQRYQSTDAAGLNPFIIGIDFYDAVKNKPLKVLDITETGDASFQLSGAFGTAFPYVEKLNLPEASSERQPIRMFLRVAAIPQMASAA